MRKKRVESVYFFHKGYEVIRKPYLLRVCARIVSFGILITFTFFLFYLDWLSNKPFSFTLNL